MGAQAQNSDTVTDRVELRSGGVRAPQLLDEPPPASGWERFEALYRSSRDDVYAYVATLLRDRSAAEDVTEQAFLPRPHELVTRVCPDARTTSAGQSQ